MNTNMLFVPLTLSPLLYDPIEDMKAKIRKSCSNILSCHVLAFIYKEDT
jgi:hypothetical protein